VHGLALLGRALLVICLCLMLVWFLHGLDAGCLGMAFHIVFIGCDFWSGEFMETVGWMDRTVVARRYGITKLLLRTQHLMRRKKRGCIAWIGPFFFLDSRILFTDVWTRTTTNEDIRISSILQTKNTIYL
jgi:hypothetical protein